MPCPSRRALLSVTLALVLFTCHGKSKTTHHATPTPATHHTAPADVTPAPATPATSQPHLDFIHLVLGGKTDEPLPWIVAFHGLGDSPENFAHLFERLPLRVHVYLPRAPRAYGSGFDWFGARVADHEGLTRGIRECLPLAKNLLDELEAKPNTVGHAVVTGFSQGGIMSFAIASAGLPHVKAAVPLAGWLPAALSTPPEVPVVAFHGDADSVVPFAATQRLIDTWKHEPRNTPAVEFHTYPGIQHTISQVMYDDWARALDRLVDTSELRSMPSAP